MFYEGDLQSGIAEAIKQAKLVVCFVHDDEEESRAWEKDFLKDCTVSSLLQQKALLLGLRAGSQEAGYLAAIYPLPKTPTLVIIQNNGQLKDYLVAGVIKSDFINRVKAALHDGPGTSNVSVEAGASTSRSEDENAQHVEPTSSSADSAIGSERGPIARELPQERIIHAESKTKEQESAEAERSAKPVEIPGRRVSPDPKKVADLKYALMQKKRQEDTRKERERILKLVEDDKVERRRAREALPREQTQAAMGPDEHEASKSSETNSNAVRQPCSKRSTQCAIQVRLFDGSIIKSRFRLDDTLGKQVRSWVDSQLVDADSPYTFKQILNPQPNRTVTTSEEEESLQSLGLTPSATFVLIAIKDYTSAYASEDRGYLSRGISAGCFAVSCGVNIVTGAVHSVFGGVAAARLRAGNEITPLPTSLATVNVRPLEDRRALSEEYQLYNGNNLNFEPRTDMDGEE